MKEIMKQTTKQAISQTMMQIFLFFVMMVATFFLMGTPTDAQGDSTQVIPMKKKHLQITPINSKITIDGRLNENTYQKMTPVEGFVQFHPENGGKPSFKTQVYAFYNKTYVYFAFRCFDNEPGKITADVTPFGQYFNNDEVEVYIDTFGDKQTYKVFGVNPRGIKKGEATIWEADAQITDFGWTAEFRIPFKSLRFPVQQIQQWQVNFKRDVFRLNETAYWSHVERDRINVFGDTFGEIHGLENIKGGKNIEIFPYAGYRRSTARTGDNTGKGTANTVDSKFAYGMDLKYGITSNLTLDMTSSPDYSEVESDPFFYQVSPYEFNLAENRPFYAEGSSYFRTPFYLFYSRRIENPNFAVKVTGKEKGYSLGTLFAQDVQPGGNAYHGVFRLKKDLFKMSRVGVIYSSIEEKENWNRNLGFDFMFQLSDVYRASGMVAFSFNRDMPASDNGMYRLLLGSQRDRGFNFMTFYQRVDPNVRVPSGFVPNVDYEWFWVYLKYAIRQENQWLEKIDFQLISRNTRSVRERLGNNYSLGFRVEIFTRSRLSLSLESGNGRARAKVNDPDTGLGWEKITYPSRFLEFQLMATGNPVVQFGAGANVVRDFVYVDDFSATTEGQYRDINLWTDLKLSPQLLVKLQWTNVRYRSFDNTIQFNGSLWASNVNYQVNRKLSAFAKIQYDTFLERFGYDLLFGYEPANVSKIYVSLKNYSTQRLRLLHPDAQSLGVKLSYLLRI